MSTPEQAGHQQPSQTSTYSHTSEYSQSEATGVAHSTHADIVSFLAVASACAIDIIPYTWLPHLESIGEGYSSSIRQSIANLTTSFAFKPFRRDPLSLSPVQKAFEEATAEIQVLGLPRIRRHPNITRLEGVCWSVSGEGDVLPVIVFEKAGLSSLSNFMQQGQTDVDVDVTHIRLSLAADIVSGLSELHSCQIIHGDLKPDNILVFESTGGPLIAKITDFGSSVLGTDTEHVGPRAGTRTWRDPGWHHRDCWDLMRAKGADMYSLGLLLLWLFFHDSQMLPDISVLPHTSNDKFGTTRLACRLVDLQQAQDIRVVAVLKLLFVICLNPDPDKRTSPLEGDLSATVLNMGEVFSEEERNIIVNVHRTIQADFDGTTLEPLVGLALLLKRCTVSLWDQVEKPVEKHSWSVGPAWPSSEFRERQLNVFDILTQLYSAHINVRVSLLKALRERVQDTSRVSPADIASLAVCYTLGFGIRKNETESARLRATLNTDILESIKQGLESFRTTYRYTRYQDSSFRECLELGHIDSIDLTQVYTNPANAERIQKDCIFELQDVTEVLGEEHHIVCTLRAHLASLYYMQGMLKEAAEEQRVLLSVYRSKYGEESKHTQSAKVNLATTYHQAGHYRSAEALVNEVLTVRIAKLGLDHMDTIRTRSDLATMYLARGNWNEAEQLLRDAVKSVPVLGPRHPFLVLLLGNFASALQNNDKLEEAQTEQRRALEVSRALHGEKHRDTIICTSNLMSIYRDRNLLNEEGDNFLKQAEKSADIAVEILGDADALSLTIRSIIAHAYIQRGRYDEAHTIANRVYEVFRHEMGETHFNTLTTLGTLAQIHFLRDEWQLAEQSYLQILNAVEGREKPDYAVILGNLASVYFHQGAYAKAADCAKRAYLHQSTQCGETHRLTVSAREKFERYQAVTVNVPTV